MTRDEFLNSIKPYAERAAAALNVPVEWVQAHWAHETGFGSNTGTKRNNLAGLYAYKGSRYGTNGKEYKDLNEFTDAYIKFVSADRYKGINQATTVTEYAKALKAGGYASDANYYKATTWTDVGGKATKDKNSLYTPPLYMTGTIGNKPQTVAGAVFDNPSTSQIETNLEGTSYEGQETKFVDNPNDPDFLSFLKKLNEVEEEDGLLDTPKKISMMIIFAVLGLIITAVGLITFTGGVPSPMGAAAGAVTSKLKGGE